MKAGYVRERVSFRGRLGGLAFFFGALAMALAFIVEFAVAVGGGAVAVRRNDGFLLLGLFLGLLPLLGATVWCSLSLYIRRICDIG